MDMGMDNPACLKRMGKDYTRRDGKAIAGGGITTLRSAASMDFE